jgi:hypothetical protein
MWGALSDGRPGLSFTPDACPRQCSHSLVRVPWDSWPYFTVSDSRFPTQGGPVTFPGTGFPFRLAGLRLMDECIRTRVKVGYKYEHRLHDIYK